MVNRATSVHVDVGAVVVLDALDVFIYGAIVIETAVDVVATSPDIRTSASINNRHLDRLTS